MMVECAGVEPARHIIDKSKKTMIGHIASYARNRALSTPFPPSTAANVGGGAGFHRRLHHITMQIPYGMTVTYVISVNRGDRRIVSWPE